MKHRFAFIPAFALAFGASLGSSHAASPAEFFDAHCTSCHDTDTHKGNLDLTTLKQDFADAENFAR